MGKYSKSKVPTLTITVDKETRKLTVDVQNWEGVSPGMMQGVEIAIDRAVHAWHLKLSGDDRRKEEQRANAALIAQRGSGVINQTNT